MITETTNTESTLLYRFFVSPKLRWARSLVFISVLGVISFNQVFIIFVDYRDLLGVWIGLLSLLYWLCYIAVVCLNIFWLFPKYLLKRRYLSYLFLLLGCMVGVLLIQLSVEYIAYNHWAQIQARGPYFSTAMAMDYISSLLLTTLCMIGGTLTVVLKEWMMDNQRVSQMEKAHVLSEVELLKEQISPELLFSTLHRSGQLTLSEPEEASKMLMKLSQLLRYQLYDCNRERVILGSEITFLTNYLTLEQCSHPQFDYTCTAEGEVNRVLVPPLLFIPFVQHAIKLIQEQRPIPPVTLGVNLKAEKDIVQFSCVCPELDLSVNRGLERIKQRLDLLYGDHYRLSLAVEGIKLELEGGEI